MDTEGFERRLRELSGLVGSEMEMDLFNSRYAVLLRDIGTLTRSKYPFLFRLRRIGYLQQQYLMNEWLRAKATDKEEESPMRQGMN